MGDSHLDVHAEGVGEAAENHDGAADLEHVAQEVRERDLLYCLTAASGHTSNPGIGLHLCTSKLACWIWEI